MKTKDFLKKHEACCDGARWALSISKEMSDVWDALIKEERYDWLLWTAIRPGVFPDAVLRKLACRVVRETPLHGGRKVWDLLTDERSRKAVEVAEAYADGKATYEELQAAYTAARAAANAAYTAADYATDYAAARAAVYAARAADYDDVAFAAADAATRAAAYAAYDATHAYAYAAARAYADAAYTQAKAAQIKMIVELGNPFRKGQKGERNNHN